VSPPIVTVRDGRMSEPGANARVPPLAWAGPETVCQLGTSSAARPETNRGTDVCPNPCGVGAIGFRVGLAVDWVCLLRSLPHRPDRCATPTAVRAGPISGGSSAHVSSYVDTACNQRCQTTVVRASSKGNRADGGAICWRAGAIEYYPGRKVRQTAPCRLVRLERKSWLRDGRPSRATSDPGRLVRPLVPRLCLGTQCPQAPPAFPPTHFPEQEAEPRQQCVPSRSLKPEKVTVT
jgi:hypothetical protein